MKKIFTIFSVIAIYLCSFNLSAQISTYCASGAGNDADTKIDSVSLNTIHQGSLPNVCEDTTDNTHLSTTLTIGHSYNLSVTNGSCGGYYGTFERAWIDFNQNGIFEDPAERVFDATSTSIHEVKTQNFTVPVTATLGTTYMRVIIDEGSLPTPCGSYTYGETEDYEIVLDWDYCASEASFTTDSKIDSVSLNTINHGSSPSVCESYTSNLGISTTLEPGLAYTLTVKNGSCGTYAANYKRAWIDFNQNGTFDDPSERIFDTLSTSALQDQSQSFTVPASPNGSTFMRVITSQDPNPQPCASYNYGETEDYSIVLFGYCTSSASNSGNSKIDSVGLNTIHEVSSPTSCEVYTNNKNISTNLIAGGTYTIAVKNGSCGAYFKNYKRAWIDFNNDGVYQDPSERVIDDSTTSALQVHSNSFTVPVSSIAGNTSMRVITSENLNPMPCTSYAFGETEDYSINILNYCTSSPTSTADTKIDSVGLNTIAQSSVPATCEDYTDNTIVATDLAIGSSYTISVKNGSCGGYYGADKRAWIDFNQNGIYENPAERVLDTFASAISQVHSNTFTVPLSSLKGVTRMRVVINESALPTPCGAYGYGETEDYTINIIDCITPVVDSALSASRCDSGTVTLSASTGDGTLYWYDGQTSIQAIDSGATFTTPVITSTTTYYVESATGCANSVRVPVVATVNASPVITSTTDDMRCDSGMVSLAAASSTGILVWYATSTGGIPLDTGLTFTTPLATTTMFYVEASDSNCTSLRDTLTATVNYSSSSSITESACDRYVSPSGLYTYTSSGIYSDTMVNATMCDSIITIDLTIIPVNVSVTQNSAVLTANASVATYQWIDCGNGNMPISGETGQTFTATANGDYAVIVTQNGCPDTSDCIAVTSVGIAGFGSSVNFNVYPNPTNGKLKIDLGSIQGKADVSLINVQGAVLKTWHFEQTDQINIDIEEPKGLYLLNISTGDNNKVFQIVKE